MEAKVNLHQFRVRRSKKHSSETELVNVILGFMNSRDVKVK